MSDDVSSLFLKPDRYKGFDVSFSPFNQDAGTMFAASFKCCVTLFAFISGYGLYKSYMNRKESAGQWTYKRYIRTFNGYWFIYILAMVVTFCIDRLPVKVFYEDDGIVQGTVNILINFFGFHNFLKTPTLVSTFWYMSFALLVILICPLVAECSKKIGCGLIFVISLVIPYVIGIEFVNTIMMVSFLSSAVLGMYMAELSDKVDLLSIGKDSKVVNGIIFIVSLAAVVIYPIIYTRLEMETYWNFILNVLPFIIIYFSLRYVTKVPVVNTVFSFLGKYSMNIFLIHTLIRVNYLRGFVYSWHSAYLIALVLLVTTLPFAVGCEYVKKWIRWDKFAKWIEEFPQKKMSKLLEEKADGEA